MHYHGSTSFLFNTKSILGMSYYYFKIISIYLFAMYLMYELYIQRRNSNWTYFKLQFKILYETFLIKYTLISLCGGGGLTGMSSELSRWNIFISFILSFDIYTP